MSRYRTPLLAAGLLFIFVILPLGLAGLDRSYLFRLAELSMLFVILAASLNLVTGTAGLVSLGHAAFYSIGAYTAAIVGLRSGLGLEATLPASVLVAGAIALVLAIPAIRLVRVFFTVATLSVGEIINITVLNWDALTRGPMGLRGIPPLSLFGWPLGGRLATYMTVAAVTLIVLWVVHRLINSPYGNALRALREDEQSASAMGIATARMKVGAFAISGGLAGAAGCLLAHSTGYISPDMFGLDQSILILTMVVVGGLGSLPGAVVGACVLIIAPELARSAGHLRTVLVGLILYICILLLPKGVLTESFALGLSRRDDKRPG